VGAGEIEAVRNAHDFDAVRLEPVEGAERVRDPAPREPIESESRQAQATA